MAALFQGRLVVRNDCVIAGDSGNLTLPIWREGFTAGRDEQDRVVVRNADGDIVAVEGEVFAMGGGYIAEFELRDKVQPRETQLRQVADSTGITIPERCLGPGVYGVWWAGGDVQPTSADHPSRVDGILVVRSSRPTADTSFSAGGWTRARSASMAHAGSRGA